MGGERAIRQQGLKVLLTGEKDCPPEQLDLFETDGEADQACDNS